MFYVNNTIRLSIIDTLPALLVKLLELIGEQRKERE